MGRRFLNTLVGSKKIPASVPAFDMGGGAIPALGKGKTQTDQQHAQDTDGPAGSSPPGMKLAMPPSQAIIPTTTRATPARQKIGRPFALGGSVAWAGVG